MTEDIIDAALALMDGHAARAAMLAHRAGRPVDSTEDAARIAERMLASFGRLLAAESAREPDASERADEVILDALEAGRPAWAAAARAVKSRLLVGAHRIDAALSELVLAELELAEELALPAPLDPPLGPTGPGAAANNLGVAFAHLRMFEAAEPHLRRAAEISRVEYGPDWAVQACIDQVNLVEFHLMWALELEADAARGRAEDHARIARDLLPQAMAMAPSSGWPQMLDYARIFELGCRTVLDPGRIGSGEAARLQELLEAGPDGSLLDAPGPWTVLARVSRLVGDGRRAGQAARRLDSMTTNDDQASAMLAWREAMLVEGPADAAATRYADALRAQVRVHRQQLAAAFDRRMELARLERSHQEVTAARQQLESALMEAKAQEADLVFAARHDALTGLLNRAGLKEELAHVSATESAVTVAFIDLDDLKQMNDEFGHAAGDVALRGMATALSTAVRAGDIVARVGGDEFVAVLVGMSQDSEIRTWATRLLESTVTGSGQARRHLRASIGACVIPAGAGIDVERAIDEGDAAMYDAKRSGKGQLRIRRLDAR